MARQTGAMITWADAYYMIANEGFNAGPLEPSGNGCLTRSDVELGLNADPYYFSTYSNNQLVPYQDIYPKIYASPSSFTNGTANSDSLVVTINCPQGNGWTATESLSWVSISPSAQLQTPSTCTISMTTNQTTSARNGTVVFTDAVTGTTLNFPVSQAAGSAVTTYAIKLGTGGSDTQACQTYDPTFSQTFYINVPDFNLADDLWTNSAGTITAASGWYADGTFVRFWNGSVFTTNGFCGGGFP